MMTLSKEPYYPGPISVLTGRPENTTLSSGGLGSPSALTCASPCGSKQGTFPRACEARPASVLGQILRPLCVLQEAWLLTRERELKEEIRKGRDQEIELVIHRLEADMTLAKEESERAAESR